MIPEGWKTYKLTDLGELHNSKRVPLNSRQRESKKGIYPYYGASGIFDYIDDYLFEGEHLLISEDGENLRTRQTPIAFKADGKFWVNNHAHIFKGRQNWLNDYMAYYLQNTDLSPYITGAVQPKLNKENLLAIPINYPGDYLGERIASILSSLDDKIELNLQMNKILEAIARAIFKEWFVDFRFPGFDGELVDVVNADRSVSRLPKGWRKGKLGDIINLKYGKALKLENRIGGKYPVVGSSGIVGFHNEPLVKSPGIVVGRKGTIGEVIWLDEEFYPIDTTFYIEDQVGATGLYFHYYLLLSQDFKKIGSDSAVPGLNRNQALMTAIICPDIDTINKFNVLLKPLFEKKYLNNQEVKTLTTMRDALLPKLMTGKIRVA